MLKIFLLIIICLLINFKLVYAEPKKSITTGNISESEIMLEQKIFVPQDEFVTKQSIQIGNISNTKVTIKQTILINYTRSQHEKIQDKRYKRLSEQSAKKIYDSQREKAFIESELIKAKQNRDNLELSYQATLLDLQNTSQQLDMYQANNLGIPSKKWAEAQNAIAHGDKTLANALFIEVEVANEKIEVDSDKNAKQARSIVASAAFQRGLIAYEDIDWKAATLHFEKAYSKQPENNIYLTKLAELYYLSGLYDKAELLNLNGLQIAISNYGENSSEVAVIRNNLGLIYQVVGKTNEAQQQFYKSILIKETLLPLGSIELAIGYDNLAGLYIDTGYLDAAEGLAQKAKIIFETSAQFHQLDIAKNYSNLALILSMKNNDIEAEQLFKNAISIKEKFLNADNPSLAAT